MRMRSVVVVLAVAIVAGACTDGVAPDARVLAPPSDAVRAIASELGRSWLEPGAEPFACFASTVAKAGAPSPYRYHRLVLRLPSAVRLGSGAVVPYQYRMVRRDGSLLRAVNCIIPRTAEAWSYMNRRLGVRPEIVESGTVALEGGCVTDGVCELEPLIVVAEPGGREPETEPECSLNGCGGTGPIVPGANGGSGSPGGGPGGEDPCAECGPQTPILTCTAVVREQTVKCSLSTGTVDVKGFGWEFSGGGHTVRGPEGATWWGGPAVTSGVVSVLAETEMTNRLTAIMDVIPRTWGWGPAQWSYSQGTATICDTAVPAVGDTVLLGWNVMEGDASCQGRTRVQPDPRANNDGLAGMTVGSGPNAGIMYVDSAYYKMRRASNINPILNGGGPALYVAGGGLCGVTTSWRSYNVCRGVNMAGLISGIWAHEGMGTNGTNGHEGAARWAAGQRANDPYVAAESIVSLPGETQFQFLRRVSLTVAQRGSAIDNHSSDRSGNVTGNYIGTVWIYDWSNYAFHAISFQA